MPDIPFEKSQNMDRKARCEGGACATPLAVSAASETPLNLPNSHSLPAAPTTGRREVLSGMARAGVLSTLGALGFTPLLSACGSEARARTFPITRMDAEWRRRLSPAAYRVLRQAGTERPYSSRLNREKRRGTYICAACNNRLYASTTKFESGTGWPSFYRPLSGAIVQDVDYKLGYARKEVLCADCGGHLGHVFNDGPRPTGKRYCMNGVAMKFRPG